MQTANGIIYGIQENGDLEWYHHDGRLTGEFRWHGPNKVGTGWGNFAQVFCGDDGVVYTVGHTTQPALQKNEPQPPATGGDLTWWRHTGRGAGTFDWEGPKRVGKNWGTFVAVFPGPDGVIYAIQPGGDLIWWRHTGRHDGTFQWEGPMTVGNGWADFSHVFCGPDGIIYAVRPIVQPRFKPDNQGNPPPLASGGELMWYRHLGQADGTSRWEGPPKKVGTGWSDFTHVFCGGDDIIYGVRPIVQPRFKPDNQGNPPPAASGGELLWYRHLGQADGTSNWQGANKVGEHWNTLENPACGGAEPIATATGAIGDFWRDTLGVLSVGTPTGPVQPADWRFHLQSFTFGQILKPADEPPVIVERFHVSVEIAAIYCFTTDDPGGTDEPYLISNTYTIDPSVGDTSVHTVEISNDALGNHETGDIFGQDQQLANNITVPGDGDITVNISLWDQELGINPEQAVGSISKTTSDAITAGLPALAAAIGSVALPGAGTVAGLEAGTVLSEVMAMSGITGAIGTAIASAVVDLLGDDLIDQKNLVIPSSFLAVLCKGDPATLEKTSKTINGMSYNFPQGPEDDSWLFDRGPGKGTYRIFLRVSKV